MNRSLILACAGLFSLVASSAYAQVNYQNDLRKSLTPDAKQYRTLWMERTQGRNLALGKPVLFSQAPAYYLTAQDNPASVLTDGKLSDRDDDRLYITKASAGWSLASIGVNWLLDLGASHPISRVVVRFLGGGEQGSLKFPAEIVLVASEDGRTFYKVGSLQKLQPADRELNGKGGMFFLPEEMRAYVYPFMFDKLDIRARYIGLRVHSDGDLLFSDELAVIEGNASGPNAELEHFPQIDFVMKGITVAPYLPLLAISTNIMTPNWFYTTDMRQGEQRKAPVTYAFDLPSAVEILQSEAGEIVKDEKSDVGVGLNRWLVKNAASCLGGLDGRDTGEIGPFYLRVRNGAALPEHPAARFSALCGDMEPRVIEAPIRLVEIPRVPRLSDIHVSLAWMDDAEAVKWPKFFEAYGHMGFNSFPVFPRAWEEPFVKERLAFLEEARKNGMSVCYQESPFEAIPGRHKGDGEIYSQLPGGPSRNLCPSYRGPWYWEEIQKVADNWLRTGADYVFMDIECTEPGASEAENCSRCKAGQLKGGKPMAEYLTDQGTEIIRDLRAAIQKRATENGRKMPQLLIYNNHAARPIYELVFSFPKLFPKLLDFASPALYVQGSAQRVHDTIRQNYAILRSRVILPWLSAGCYGKFEPYKMEGIVLESLLNGAMGITYYCFSDFNSPLYFYYHSHALALVAPYEQLLKNGDLREVSCNDPRMTLSAWGSESEALVLVGNYRRRSPASATVTLPFAKVTSILDVRTGQQLPPGRVITVSVSDKEPPLLFYVKGDNVHE